MNTATTLDLGQLLTSSLCLEANATAPARNMYPCKAIDPYQEWGEKNPFEVLGEKTFGQPKIVPKTAVGTPIQEFYRGLNVMITGGTGFIGKILMEKLIRSIPHLGYVYILIRNKHGKCSKERFDEHFQDKVFMRVKAEVPNYLSKIRLVEGDLSKSGLGLSADDRQLVLDHVNVIFHSAADVRFIEPLRKVLECNVLGTKMVLELAKEIKHLKALVYVSTAYSHCVRRVIEENVPQMSINYNELLAYVCKRTDEEIERETLREAKLSYNISMAMNKYSTLNKQGRRSIIQLIMMTQLLVNMYYVN